MATLSPIDENQLIDSLYTLDAARRGVLELRYPRGLPLSEICELLGVATNTAQELLEDAVERLVMTLGVESVDQGVALILRLSKLSPEAWGDRTTGEIAALARDEIDRQEASPLETEGLATRGADLG